MSINKLHLFALLGFMILTGCASFDYGKVVGESIVKIERQRSRIADVGQVTIYQQKEGYLVRGTVRRNVIGRSHIQGHLDIALLDAKGKVIYETSSKYKHSGIRFDSEKFSFKIDKKIEKGSLLRITHDEYVSHKNSKLRCS